MKSLSTLIVCGFLVLMLGAISPVASQGFSVDVDIKPRSCPNPCNVNSKGVIPVAILGTEDFEVTQVDPTTVELEGVPALRWNFEDVSTPAANGGPYTCTTEGSDGFMDMTFKFKTQEIVEALDGDVSDGDMIFLYLTGMTHEGRYFAGQDWVVIIKKGHNDK